MCNIKLFSFRWPISIKLVFCTAKMDRVQKKKCIITVSEALLIVINSFSFDSLLNNCQTFSLIERLWMVVKHQPNDHNIMTQWHCNIVGHNMLQQHGYCWPASLQHVVPTWSNNCCNHLTGCKVFCFCLITLYVILCQISLSFITVNDVVKTFVLGLSTGTLNIFSVWQKHLVQHLRSFLIWLEQGFSWKDLKVTEPS